MMMAVSDQVVTVAHQPRSLALDLRAQLEGLDTNGQFRFTPPTHAMLACRQALADLKSEGGVSQRARRYGENHRVLIEGMHRLGFAALVPSKLRSHIISAFAYPKSRRFDFDEFYHRLADYGMLIYPGKLSRVDCFRVGSIGELTPHDFHRLISTVERVLSEMNVSLGPEP